MKLATWNVNSVRSREERLLRWLDKTRPDVLCLQELKTVDASFPRESIEAAGYRVVVFGQKTYNGVAILSRVEPTDVQRGMGDVDPEARLLAAEISGIRIINAYFPNGQAVGSEKWAYKLDWMRRLAKHLDRHYRPSDPVILCGDFNVVRDDLDAARPDDWAGTVLCHPDAREGLEAIRQWGFTDVFREHHPAGGVYSWWDYRMLAFPKNNGLRLDHIFATAPMAWRCRSAEIDRDERKGAKPSDHAPVVAVFED
jgi:exodeoxyribonuclease III